jgi:hypothetical protein
MSKYETRVTQVTVAPAGEAIFSERAFNISIQDYAAGEFLTIESKQGKISIDKDEWEVLRAAIDSMLQTIRP